jgi:hypothetical protein
MNPQKQDHQTLEAIRFITPVTPDLDLTRTNQSLHNASASEVIEWADRTFGSGGGDVTFSH